MDSHHGRQSFRWFGAFFLTILCSGFLLPPAQALAQDCVGDCNGDGEVSIDELVTAINVALGLASLESCPSLDVTGDDEVSIDELLLAVDNALGGCSMFPTPTQPTVPATPVPTDTPSTPPTATATQPTVPATPVPTDTPAEADTATPVPTDTPAEVDTATPTVAVTDTATQAPTATSTAPPTATASPEATATDVPRIESVAGNTVLVVNGVSVVPNVIAAIIAGVTGGGGSGAAIGSGAGNGEPCEVGGTVETIGSLPDVTYNLNNCEVSRPDGSVVFDGSVSVNVVISGLSGTASMNVDITFKDQMGATTLTSTADLTGDIILRVRIAPGADCTFEIGLVFQLSGVDLVLSGTIASITPAGDQISMTFDATDVIVRIMAYGPDCVPTEYRITMNGNAGVMRSAGGGAGGATQTFDLLFTDFIVSATGDEFSVEGMVTSTCSGGTVTLSTVQSLRLILGEFCPSAGQINVQDIGDILYNNGGLTVDSMGSQQMFETCSDDELFQCVEQ